MKSILVFGVGFLAQFLFFARTIVQWFKSENEGKVISPVLFWQLSLLAAILMFVYGILRNDPAILLGQFLTYFIYIRNLQLKHAWKKIPPALRLFFVLLPGLFPGWLLLDRSASFSGLINNEDIGTVLMIWGIAGQLLFNTRFIYQWIYSETRKDSVLPLGFWIISLGGAVMIFIYSIFREDPVLFLAHSLGIFLYIRNLMLYSNQASLFDRINIPFVNKLIRHVSKKIK